MEGLAAYLVMILLLPILAIGFLLPLAVFLGMPLYTSGWAACGFYANRQRKKELEDSRFNKEEFTEEVSFLEPIDENVIYLYKETMSIPGYSIDETVSVEKINALEKEEEKSAEEQTKYGT